MKLRTFTLDDAPRVTALLQDEEISYWTSEIPFPYTEADAIAWIKKGLSEQGRNPFAILADDEMIGCVSYWFNSDQELEVGYWLGKDYWGRGYASEALAQLMALTAFPKNTPVVARIRPDNTGSKRVLLNNGFVLRGEGQCQKLNSTVDALIYIREPSIA